MIQNGQEAPNKKADLFATHLEETFRPLPRQTADEDITPIIKSDEQEIPPVTLQELIREIKNNLIQRKRQDMT